MRGFDLPPIDVGAKPRVQIFPKGRSVSYSEKLTTDWRLALSEMRRAQQTLVKSYLCTFRVESDTLEGFGSLMRRASLLEAEMKLRTPLLDLPLFVGVEKESKALIRLARNHLEVRLDGEFLLRGRELLKGGFCNEFEDETSQFVAQYFSSPLRRRRARSEFVKVIEFLEERNDGRVVEENDVLLYCEAEMRDIGWALSGKESYLSEEKTSERLKMFAEELGTDVDLGVVREHPLLLERYLERYEGALEKRFCAQYTTQGRKARNFVEPQRSNLVGISIYHLYSQEQIDVNCENGIGRCEMVISDEKSYLGNVQERVLDILGIEV